MPVLLLLYNLLAAAITALTPEAVALVKAFLTTNKEKINLESPDLLLELEKLLAANPVDYHALSVLGVRIHETIRRSYPPDVSGDQSQYEDKLYRSPQAAPEGTPAGLPGASEPVGRSGVPGGDEPGPPSGERTTLAQD
jgi:hypothetical protein